MADALAFGTSASQFLSGNPFTQDFRPVLGLLNGPNHAGSTLTAYGRQVGRSLLKHLRCTSDSGAAAGSSQGPEGSAGSSQSPEGSAEPTGAASWHTINFARVDDIPRRKAHGGGQPEAGAGAGAGAEADGDMAEQVLGRGWAGRQQGRPATVLSMHTLAAAGEQGADVQLAEALARTRVCLASYGVAYTAVLIINRAVDEEPGTERRVAALVERAGMAAGSAADGGQLAVCRPGPAAQFARLLADVDRRLLRHRHAHYAAAFMRAQAKLAALPQLPLATSTGSLGGVYAAPPGIPPALLQWQQRQPPGSPRRVLRASLARYYFKMGAAAESLGEAVMALRCFWLSYVHVATLVAEVAGGAYLPGAWLWAANGGAGDGARAHALRMFGARWDDAVALLAAVHLRIVRGWVRRMQAPAASRLAGRPPVRSVGRPPVGIAAAAGGGSSAAPAPPESGAATGAGVLDSAVLPVHAGEGSPVTAQLVDHERQARAQAGGAATAYFLVLAPQSAGADLLPAAAADAWWPAGGHFGAADYARAGGADAGRLAARQCAEHARLVAA
ncbi:hypothetical protein GGF37_002110, partial [Kickxella alabastrina]